MKQQLIADITREMLPVLNNYQLQQLQKVLNHCFYRVDVKESESQISDADKKSNEDYLDLLDRLPSSVNGLSRINSASNNAILESGREAPYVQEIAVQRPDFC